MYLRFALAATSLLAITGCATERVHERVAIRGAHERVVIRTAPPPPRQEVIIDAPGPRERFVWDPGHYRWDHGQYVWEPGHWIERRGPRAEWIAGHWAERHGEWVWVDGRWR